MKAEERMPAKKAKSTGTRRRTPAAKRASKRPTLSKQMVQDVYVGSSTDEIERSFRRSKSESLAAFRSKIGW
jgi:hypothetical protein